MTRRHKIYDSQSGGFDMETLLMENGYKLGEMDHESKERNGIKKIRIKSKAGAVFFILYELQNNEKAEISSLYDFMQETGDEFCSLFFLKTLDRQDCYSKNMKTGQYNQLRNLVVYQKHQKNASTTGSFEVDKFENVFFEAHSFLRDIDGLHPDEALDELCKIIYAKLYDEESSLNIFGMTCGNVEEYAANVRRLYKEANEYDMRVYSLKIPGYKRSRGVFAEPIYLSANAIQRVGQLFAKYNFSDADIDYKARAFQNVYKPTTRSGMGQYFTPIQVIRLIVNCIAPTSNDLIMDPFSGSAHFLTESLDYITRQGLEKKSISEFIFYKLHGIEKSERMVRIAMTDMRLHGDGHSNIRCVDSLLPFETYTDLSSDTFDVIMTNPPFGSVLQKESYSYLGNFELLKGKGKVPLEVLGLERSIQLLRDGGRLGIVLPESIFVNKSYLYVRNWLKENIKIRGIISLPQSTFSPFGANIKTSVLIASKGKTVESYKVFTGTVENIGFDSKGDELEGADWEEVSKKFNTFINMEGW